MTPPDRSEQAARRLRVGLVLDSYNVSAWMASVIDDLLSANFLDVGPVVLLGQGPEGGKGNSGTWLFRRYAEWDRLRGGLADDPLRVVDVSNRLAGHPTRTAVEAIPAYDLDVLIWFASPEPGLAARKTARHGVWLYRPRQTENFWELYERNPVSRSALEAWRTGSEAPQTLYEAFSATEQGWSWLQNRKAPYARASTFALRCLRQLREPKDVGEEAAVYARPVPAPDQAPTNLQMASFFLRNAVRTVGRRIRYARKESHWFVAYRSDTRKFVANSEEIDLKGFKKIQSPEGHFYADPFVIAWRGRNYLFVEDYLFEERRGCISVMEMGDTGVTSEAERVLDLPYHLSYPFVFECGGELYMIPETLAAGRIELYRATDGPMRWEFVKALREDVQAVDTTLWMEDGRFYFFTNIAERGSTVNDDLYLFHADDLLGEWQPHPLNPLVTDVRRSRGAGKLFRRNGKLIRPAQDCSVRYGYACQLNAIERLTPTEYRERALRRIEPDWAPGLIGTHTINSNEKFEVIDGQIYGNRYAG